MWKWGGKGQGSSHTWREDLTECSKLRLLEMEGSRSLLSNVSRNSLSQDVSPQGVLHQIPSPLLLGVVLVSYL